MHQLTSPDYDVYYILSKTISFNIINNEIRAVFRLRPVTITTILYYIGYQLPIILYVGIPRWQTYRVILFSPIRKRVRDKAQLLRTSWTEQSQTNQFPLCIRYAQIVSTIHIIPKYSCYKAELFNRKRYQVSSYHTAYIWRTIAMYLRKYSHTSSCSSRIIENVLNVQ